MPEQQEEPNSDTEVGHEPEVFGRVYDFILVCEREHNLTKSPERYGYEDLADYALITSYGDLYTFR